MKTSHLQTCLQLKKTYNIAEGLKVKVEVLDNPFNIPLDNLFSMAMRINPKRRFLFVSKVLGKHLPTDPQICLLTGFALAIRFLEVVYQIVHPLKDQLAQALENGTELRDIYHKLREATVEIAEKNVFIGFAETATALGHSMFSFFSGNATYTHTTRENILEISPSVIFEEEHSHATSHRFYGKKELLENDSTVVLIDDEITTGNTAVNIIRSIQGIQKRKKYVVVSILDWRSLEDRQKFLNLEKELDTKIQFVSLVEGTINIEQNVSLIEKEIERLNLDKSNQCENVSEKLPSTHVLDLSALGLTTETLTFSSVNSKNKINCMPYIKYTGRFGITPWEQKSLYDDLSRIASYLKDSRTGKTTLCIGTGEFMYIPMYIASLMGDGVSYQSTTRSPIFPVDREDYAINTASSFKNPEDPYITNYLYNIPYGHYDDLYLFCERDSEYILSSELVKNLQKYGIPNVFLVMFY